LGGYDECGWVGIQSEVDVGPYIDPKLPLKKKTESLSLFKLQTQHHAKKHVQWPLGKDMIT
jgi:hypothetical protein